MVVVVYLLEQTNKHVKVWKVPYVNERMWMDEHGLDWFGLFGCTAFTVCSCS